MFLFHDYLNVKYLISRTPSPSVFKCVGWGRRAGCASVGRVLWGVLCRICFVGSAVPLYRRFSFSSSFYFLCCCTVHAEPIPNECGARTYHTDRRATACERAPAHRASHCVSYHLISSHFVALPLPAALHKKKTHHHPTNTSPPSLGLRIQRVAPFSARRSSRPSFSQ